jgi:dTDP-4-dehydrorhamnose 3,5-epimerase
LVGLTVELSAWNRKMIYIPKGCAHGFQTLQDDTEVLYHMAEFHVPACAAGVRGNDPAFGVAWPDGKAAAEALASHGLLKAPSDSRDRLRRCGGVSHQPPTSVPPLNHRGDEQPR